MAQRRESITELMRLVFDGRAGEDSLTSVSVEIALAALRMRRTHDETVPKR